MKLFQPKRTNPSGIIKFMLQRPSDRDRQPSVKRQDMWNSRSAKGASDRHQAEAGRAATEREDERSPSRKPWRQGSLMSPQEFRSGSSQNQQNERAVHFPVASRTPVPIIRHLLEGFRFRCSTAPRWWNFSRKLDLQRTPTNDADCARNLPICCKSSYAGEPPFPTA